MIGFVLAVLLFVAVGVVLIVRRAEMAAGLAMFSGASTPPGCAVAAGLCFFALAALAVVLYRIGALGSF
ncbi:MAG: hypothetical protein K0Q72_3385 [Armatimonadetes bacterium]|jgi:hypothetical protein|nr:hypothetical protein [Armatimonadota bacterium]